MPRPFVLHRSGAHRLACLSLYRALLRQCHHIETSLLGDTQPQTLSNLVRYRFRQDRLIDSPSKAANGLHLASNYLFTLQRITSSSLDDSSAALISLSQLLDHTSTLAQQTSDRRSLLESLRKPIRPSRIPHQTHVRTHTDPANHIPRSGTAEQHIFTYPLPLSEIIASPNKPNPTRRFEKTRAIPYLLQTNGIPFLRYPGKQPFLLSRYIRNERKGDVIRLGHKEYIRDELRGLSWAEDEWETIVEDEMRRLEPEMACNLDATAQWEHERGQSATYTATVDAIEQDLDRIHRSKLQSRAEMTKRLYRVAVAEKEMAAVEAEERMDRRFREKERARAAEKAWEETGKA